MSKADIGPRIGIEGFAEFKKNLGEIDAKLKVNASEMRKVTAEYDANDKSLEALTARGGTLEKQLQSQRSKVEELQKVVNASTEATGEASTQTMSWQTKLNNAEAELIKLNKAVEENASELQEAAKKTDELGDQQDATKGQTLGLGDALGGLTSKLGIELPDGAKESLNSLGGLDSGMLLAVGSAAALAAGIYKVIDALADMTIQSAQLADDIMTQSAITGISTEALQEMAYAAELVDVDVSTMSGSMTKLIRTMQSAKLGTKETAEAYARLGISITDSNGELRDSETVFWETIDALGKMTNETERDALAMTIMGKSARDLNPLIKAGSETMAELADEARDMNYVLSEEALATLGDLDDQMQRFGRSTEATKNMIAVEFAPALTGLMETGQNLFSALGEAAEESGIVDVFNSLLEVANALSPAIEVLLDLLGPAVGSVLKPVAFTLALIADVLTMIVSSLAFIVEGTKYLLGHGSMDKLNKYADNIVAIFEGEGATMKFLEAQLGREAKALGTEAPDISGSLTSQSSGSQQRAGSSTSQSSASYSPSLASYSPESPLGHQQMANEISNLIASGQFPVQNAYTSRNVITNTYTKQGDTIHVSIDMKKIYELNDLVQMAQAARQDGRAR